MMNKDVRFEDSIKTAVTTLVNSDPDNFVGVKIGDPIDVVVKVRMTLEHSNAINGIQFKAHDVEYFLADADTDDNEVDKKDDLIYSRNMSDNSIVFLMAVNVLVSDATVMTYAGLPTKIKNACVGMSINSRPATIAGVRVAQDIVDLTLDLSDPELSNILRVPIGQKDPLFHQMDLKLLEYHPQSGTGNNRILEATYNGMNDKIPGNQKYVTLHFIVTHTEYVNEELGNAFLEKIKATDLDLDS